MKKSITKRRIAIFAFLYKASPFLVFAGTISIWFGLMVFYWRDLTLAELIWLFGISIIVQGISYTIAGMIHRREEYQWFMLLTLGIIHIIGGLAAIILPGITSLIFLKLMGVIWLAGGIIQIFAAIRLREEIWNVGWLVLAGVVSIASGIFMIINAGNDAMALMWIIPLYAVCFGLLMIIFGLQIKYKAEQVSEDLDE